MDLSFLQHPAILTALVSAIVWLVGKAIRMQTKVDRLAESDRANTAETAELKASFQAHKDNSDIHFNLRISQEVDRRNEQRFVTIERQLGEINVKLDKLTERE